MILEVFKILGVYVIGLLFAMVFAFGLVKIILGGK